MEESLKQCSLYDAILFCSQQFAKTYDPDATGDQRRDQTIKVNQYNRVLEARLNGEPNGETLRKIWMEYRLSLAAARELDAFIRQKDLEGEFSDYQSENTP